jgi:hypothetical protein
MADTLGFLGMHCIAGLTRCTRGNVPIALGRTGEHIDLARRGCVEFAAAAARHDRLTFKLGNDSWHLAQQWIRWRGRDGTVAKDAVHASAWTFLDEHEVMGVVAG